MSEQTYSDSAATAKLVFPVDRIRDDFPILRSTVYEQPLVYLDNAATTQKPLSVIERIERYYREENSNVHRGVHYLSQRATDAYEAARERVRSFVNARSVEEIVFTRGTTESINLVCASFLKPRLKAGDEVVITTMEHHSNIVPWQLLCDQVGARLQVVPLDPRGDIVYEEYLRLLNGRTRLVAICHTSNSLGTVNPIRQIVRDAKINGIPVVVDGAQAVQHGVVDVRQLDCDFFCFSSHKMYGPTGFGVLYGRRELLAEMPPYQAGGDMISSVSFSGTTFNELPHRFEAGTPHIEGAIGMAAAIDYLEDIGLDAAASHEADVLAYGTAKLENVEGLRLIGTAKQKAAVLSFVIDGLHPYDIGTILDRLGVAVRTGHHCTQPLMTSLGLPGTVRASLGVYNTRSDIDRLVDGVLQAKRLLS